MTFDELVAQADRAVQLELGGESVTYQPQAGEAATPIGVFDLQYVLAKGGAEAGAEVTAPAVFFRLEDLPVDPRDDEPTLTIREVTYRVVERRPDGMGGIVLVLRTFHAPPVAAFSWTANELEVTFADESTDDAGVASWEWDFGDDSTSTEQSPTHTYDEAGTYEVTLTVTDLDGEVNAQSQSVIVSVDP